MLKAGGIAYAIRGLKLRRMRRSQPEPAPSAISFSVAPIFPEKVLEAPGGHKAVGKMGKGFVYSLVPCPSDRDIERESGMTKTKVINEILSTNINAPDAYSTAWVSSVQGMAERICGKTSNESIVPYIVAHEIAGYGPISIIMEDSKDVEEILVNKPTDMISIYHAKYGYCATNMRFRSESDLRFVVNRILGQSNTELGEGSPIVDAQLPDGSRIHAQSRPYAVSGAAVSIRLGGSKKIDIARLLRSGTANPYALAYLWMAIESEVNIIIAGAPSSGKTSLLMALNAFMPRYERIITIEEDVNELLFYSNFVNSVSLKGISGKSKASLKDQVVNSLHMRPDRILVGEIRGDEARDVFFGSNLGIPFATTMHAMENGTAIISRLRSKPMSVEPSMVSMLDVSVFMKRSGMEERKVDSIFEYSWLSRGEIAYSEGGQEMAIAKIFESGEPNYPAIRASKIIKRFSSMNCISIRESVTELKSRSEFLSRITGIQGPSRFDADEYVRSYSAKVD
ncbi:Flp pilus assembly complex ATPase component TadA [Candidatus Marsarchaeota archaeon]|nr:Flp pilus assembly complex ATPase component TadA [Candidatus Marsarchaeota archaeon]